MSSLFSPYVTVTEIAEALCVSERTATRYCAPLRKELGLRKCQSLTKKQVEDYFGDMLKKPIRYW